MRMGITGRVGMVAAVLAALVLTVGCSASRRTQDRVNVLTAENVDKDQQLRATQAQARDAMLAQDRTQVALQEEKHRARQLENQATAAEMRAQQGDQALARLDQSRQESLEQAKRLERMMAEVDRLDRIAREAKVKPVAPGPLGSAPSPHLDAFARDLRTRLMSAGIDLPVEMRTSRDGRRRAAVVLTNAFPAGKDSLTYNMDAVRAVVKLGQLISTSYPGSRVSVEGHTDSDPIRRSKWASNEHLSQARAESVRVLLVKAGVQESLVDTAGLGARQPIEAGSTKRAKAQNRRVEIYVEPQT